MKKIIFLSTFILLCSFSFAQDTIVTTSGEKIPAIVSSITPNEIQYKKYGNQDGPSYTRSKLEVKAVLYKNGTSDVFDNAATARVSAGSNFTSTPVSATQLNISNVLAANQIVFYGFDFTNFSLIEPKRARDAQQIKDVNFPEWNQYFASEVPANTLSRWMKKSSVIYNTSVINKINTEADASKVVAFSPTYEPMNDKIKRSVAQYALADTQTSGIGFVVNVEYCDKRKKETSAYFTFFDISTHAVIYTDRITVRKVEGAGLTKFWGAGFVQAMKDFIDKKYKKF